MNINVTSNTMTILSTQHSSYPSSLAKTSPSNPNSFVVSVIQGTGAININPATTVPISQYFTISNALCSFSSCDMYVGTTPDSQYSVTYTGSGPTATVQFQIPTTLFATKNLNLGCTIASTSQIVYSSNTIAFTVIEILDPTIQKSYTYSFNQYGGSKQEPQHSVSIFFNLRQSLQSCNFQDSASTTTPKIQVQLSGSYPSQQLLFTTITSSSFSTNNFYLNCLLEGTTSSYAKNTNAIQFTVNPCQYTIVVPSMQSYIYTQRQNNGSMIESYQQISNFISGQSDTCYFQSCVFLKGSSIFSQVVAILQGSQTSQMIQFITNTSAIFSIQALQLKCLSTDSTQTTNTYAIKFEVQPCNFTGLQTQSYSLQQYTNKGVMLYQELNIFQFIAPSNQYCIIQNCVLIDQFGKQPQFANFYFDQKSSTYSLNISSLKMTYDLPTESTQTKVQCNNEQGKLIGSQYFSIQIICGPKSVTVLPKSTFRKVTYYKINKDNQATYLFDNFTTSNPVACPIISHKLAISQNNLDSPSYISIQEGNQQFKILNVSMSYFPHEYNFYINATAEGGAYFMQQVFIYNFIDCKDDEILIKNSLPDKIEPFYNLYKIDGKFPVLKISHSSDSLFKASIKQRFTNKLSDFCPITSFNIRKVVCNSVDIKDFQNYFAVSKSGILQTLNNGDKILQKCHIFVQAFNGLIWGGQEEQYIADISSYKNKDSQNSTFQQKQQVIQKQQEAKNISIQSKQNNTCNYRIDSISFSGKVKLKFGSKMEQFNLSYINQSSAIIYVMPFQKNDDSNFALNWTATSFSIDTMFIQLNFFNLLDISSQTTQDRLVINFNTSDQYLNCSINNQSLSLQKKISSGYIPRQLIQGQQNVFNGIQLFSNGQIAIMVMGAILLLFFDQTVEQWVIFIRSLQFILHLAMMKIQLPANVLIFYQMLFQISNYDISSLINLWNLPFFRDIFFNHNVQIHISQQMQNIAYDERNSFKGLGTFAFIILFNFVRIILAGLLRIFQQNQNCLKYSQNLNKKIEKDLFFNVFLESTVEIFFTLLISGYLNVRTLEFISFGETVGAILSFYSLFLTLFVILICNVWVIKTKNKELVSQSEFKMRWGSLVNYLNYKNLRSKLFYLIFILRRQIYIGILLLCKNLSPGLFLTLFCFSNFLYIIYIGSGNPFQNINLYWLEILNEQTFAMCSYMMTFFTDWVTSQEAQYKFGWIMVSIILFSAFINICIILYHTIYKIFLSIYKYFNLVQKYFNTKTQKNQQISNYENKGPNILQLEQEISQLKIQQQKDILKKIQNKIDNEKLPLRKMRLIGPKNLKNLQENPKSVKKLNMSQISEDKNEDECIIINQQKWKQQQTIPGELQVETKLIPIITPRNKVIQPTKKEEMFNETNQANEFFKKHKKIKKLDKNIQERVVQIFKVLNDSKYQIPKQTNEDLKTLYQQIEIDTLLIKSGTLLYPQSREYIKLEKKLDDFMKEVQKICKQ